MLFMQCFIYLLYLLVLVSASFSDDDWSPPENPNPTAILQEARDDAQAKNYEIALAKHVWYHENALAIEPAQYGVRLSFALSYWAELAKDYPPALTKMKEIRNQEKKNLMEGKNVRDSFHAMSAFNQQLDEQTETKQVFEILDQKHPKIAKQVFDLAKSSLVHAKAYPLFAKYVSPKDDLARMIENFRQLKDLASEGPMRGRSIQFAKKNFVHNVTTLVAILAVTDRKSEAKEIADSARGEWDDSSFHDALDKALEGIVPDPWP